MPDFTQTVSDDELTGSPTVEETTTGRIASSEVMGSGIAIGEGAHVLFQYYQPVVQNVFSNLSEEELHKAYRRLMEQIEEYFDIVAETLHDNHSLQEEALERLQKAKELLQNRAQSDDPEWNLGHAQFEVRRVHVAISKEQQIQRGEKRLSWMVPVLVIFYVAVIVVAIAFGGQAWSSTTLVPIIEVPISILLWAAIGSVSAILYRFYKRQRGRVSQEVRWLIARPIIGIVMGALAYLAVVSGLFIFGTATGLDANAEDARLYLLWVLAFLAGFSDKVFEAIIETVSGKLSGPVQGQSSASRPETK